MQKDFSETVARRKATMQSRGTAAGRPAAPLVHTICNHCKNTFLQKDVKFKKSFCNQECYNFSKRGKRVVEEGFDWSKRNTKTPARLAINEARRSRNNIKGYKRFCVDVRRLTEQNYVKFMRIINPLNLPRTLNGVVGGYQIDHIKSVKQCWNECWTAEQAASVDNLQMITWQENSKKRDFSPPKPKENDHNNL